MGQLLYSILKTTRPRQWIKNLAVFTPIIFTGQLFNGAAFWQSFWAFIALCFLSSSNYIFNDILDAPHDRKHPFKKFRPIASGKLPRYTAAIVSIIFVIIGLNISVSLGQAFLIMAIIFILLEYFYSLVFKHFTVIDILTISGAYFVRVYAGEAATGFHISIWLALAVLSLALFLAIGKRRAELTLMQGYKNALPRDTRESLLHYSEKLLDTYTAMFANSTFITYMFYTFLAKLNQPGFFLKNISDLTLDIADRKWMIITIPFVLFGIMRYMQLIYEGQGESPEQILTSDPPLLITVILWVTSVLFVVYGIGSIGG